MNINLVSKLVLLILVSVSFSLAGNEVRIKVEWDASPSPGVAKYRLVYAGDGGIGSVMTSATSLTLSLRHNSTYTLSCFAVDNYGQESVASNSLILRVRK